MAAAGTPSENNLIINYLPSHVTEIELRVSSRYLQFRQQTTRDNEQGVYFLFVL